MTHSPTRAALLFLSLSLASPLLAQQTPAPTPPPAAKLADPTPDDISNAITRGVELLLSMQESMVDGNPKAEWPYEGVYRVNRQIPIGYRIGGTSIVSMALLQAPGYADDAKRKDAIARALRFVLDATSDPLMNPDYDGGYDVRGWGYTYRLLFLLNLKSANAIPDTLTNEVTNAIKWDIKAIQDTEIPKVGGWNYARSAGKAAVSRPSPFMTAPTLEALFEAHAQGFEVDDDVIDRAVATLVSARSATGSLVYAGASDENRPPEPVQGAVGRMLAAESTLFLCGKSDLLHVRAALDAFIAHWEWLDKRRAQNGTHIPPYSIAPYYFYFAHYYAAKAIELLPQRDRAEYRRRLHQLIFSVRLEDGSWNDRVFTRTRNYSTAMCLMALGMPDAPHAKPWTDDPAQQATD